MPGNGRLYMRFELGNELLYRRCLSSSLTVKVTRQTDHDRSNVELTHQRCYIFECMRASFQRALRPGKWRLHIRDRHANPPFTDIQR